MFNVEARRFEECINCFCFGKTTSCQSADLFTYHIPPPFNQYKIIGVQMSPDGSVEVRPEITMRTFTSSLRPINNGFQIYSRSESERADFNQETLPFFAMPETYHRNQLKSYGGYLKYTLRYDGNGRPVQAPDVVLTVILFCVIHIYINYPGKGEKFQLSAGQRYSSYALHPCSLPRARSGSQRQILERRVEETNAERIRPCDQRGHHDGFGRRRKYFDQVSIVFREAYCERVNAEESSRSLKTKTFPECILGPSTLTAIFWTRQCRTSGWILPGSETRARVEPPSLRNVSVPSDTPDSRAR